MQRDIDEAEVLLLKWADFMRSGICPPDGWAAKAQGGFIESWVKDNDDLVEAADAYEMGNIQAAIDSLSVPHNRIIYKTHRISHMVWSFPDEDALYHAARASFSSKYFGK